MPVYKVDAVILRHQPVGEADRVLTLLTREHGKVRASARGVRRTTSRLAGRVQPYTQGRFLLARGRTLDVVAQAEVVRAFAGLQHDLLRSAYAAYVAELVDRFLPERDRHPEVFEAVLDALAVIETATEDEAEIYALWFSLHLADSLGYRPEMERCVACGRPLPAGGFAAAGAAERVSPTKGDRPAVRGGAAWAFSPAAGGAVCPACAAEHHPSAARVAPGVLATGAYLLRSTAERARRLRVQERPRRELAGLVQAHLEYHLDGRLRAPGVIARLRLAVPRPLGTRS
ncbi:MAG TPA: DNA repair protein RecO [bacterium]|nr:DNA repair protein RecO [bacterium]